MTNIAHVALYDTLADWEIGYLLVELRTGRFTGQPFEIVTVGTSTEPVTTMGGLRILPDQTLDEIEPASSRLLILAGAEMWDDGRGQPFADAARRFLAAGTPVAAICGATAGLARVGLLDDRDHTSAAAEYLAATGYAGAGHYRDERAVDRRRPHHRRTAEPGPVRRRHVAAARPCLGRHWPRRTRRSCTAATRAPIRR